MFLKSGGFSPKKNFTIINYIFVLINLKNSKVEA